MQHLRSSPLLCLLLVFGMASAAPAPMNNDPKRPVKAISHDLGVKPAEFIACFRQVHPAQQGEHPSQMRVHANKAVLLTCLQQANPAITNEKLDQVMDRYRPGGHAAQQPAYQ